MAECTFRPITNSNRSNSSAYVPIQERVIEIQMVKKERIEQQNQEKVHQTSRKENVPFFRRQRLFLRSIQNPKNSLF